MHARFFGCVALGVEFGVYGAIREDGRLGAGEAGGGRGESGDDTSPPGDAQAVWGIGVSLKYGDSLLLLAAAPVPLRSPIGQGAPSLS